MQELRISADMGGKTLRIPDELGGGVKLAVRSSKIRSNLKVITSTCEYESKGFSLEYKLTWRLARLYL